MQRQIEIRRIAQRGQNVPGRCNGQNDKRPAHRMQPSPDVRMEQLPRNGQINHARSQREHHADQALQQQADAQARRQQKRPPARPLLLVASIARRNAHIDNVMSAVTITSGIRIRVKRNKPMQVEMHNPA